MVRFASGQLRITAEQTNCLCAQLEGKGHLDERLWADIRWSTKVASCTKFDGQPPDCQGIVVDSRVTFLQFFTMLSIDQLNSPLSCAGVQSKPCGPFCHHGVTR